MEYRATQSTVVYLIAGAVWLAPLALVAVSALERDVLSGRVMSGSEITLQNLQTIWSKGLPDALAWSLIVGVSSAFLTVVLSLGVGTWCLGEDKKVYAVLASAVFARCVPPIALLLAHLTLVTMLRIPDSWPLLVLFHSTSALPIALMVIVPRLNALHAGSHGSAPLGELAKLDDLSGDRYLLQVLCPNMIPHILLAWLLSFALSWGEFLYAGVFCPGARVTTLPVMIATLETNQRMEWGPLYALMIVSVVGAALVMLALHLVLLAVNGGKRRLT